jgi:hypothetical protein
MFTSSKPASWGRRNRSGPIPMSSSIDRVVQTAMPNPRSVEGEKHIADPQFRIVHHATCQGTPCHIFVNHATNSRPFVPGRQRTACPRQAWAWHSWVSDQGLGAMFHACAEMLTRQNKRSSGVTREHCTGADKMHVLRKCPTNVGGPAE